MDEFLRKSYIFNQNEDEEIGSGLGENEEGSEKIGEDSDGDEKKEEEFLSPDDDDSSVSGDEI